MASMSGKQIKERLERDLGFESNRARLLTEAVASKEISTFWEGKGLDPLDEKNYTALAKASLISGLAGTQKLEDLITKLEIGATKVAHLAEVALEISALVLEHQRTLNLSRNRASCVNAHFNVLDPERSLTQIYSPYFSPGGLKNFTKRSENLLERNISSGDKFTLWIKEVHEVLADVSIGDEKANGEELLTEGVSRKGLISRKAISTYFKQWELFATEKLGPFFSIQVIEDEASPLAARLNDLESGASRTWTTMLGDITEARTSTVFQKRANAVTERNTFTLKMHDLNNYDLVISDRPLKIQMSSSVYEEVIRQFVKAMKAQFLVYSGKGSFNVALQSGNSAVTVSLLNATKADLKKIEEILLQLA